MITSPRELLAALAADRPIYHSEADFQHAFAWQARIAAPTADIRLEVRLQPGRSLDLLFRDDSGRVGAELKYLTRRFGAEWHGERFELANQAAGPVRRYDVVKDIVRVEDLLVAGLISRGYVILVTNEPTYWSAPVRAATSDAMFRLEEGRTLSGPLGWGPNTGVGTMRRREQPLELRGSYVLHWTDFSQIDDAGGGRFRALLVDVNAGLSASRAPSPPGVRRIEGPTPNGGVVADIVEAEGRVEIWKYDESGNVIMRTYGTFEDG